jgi:hypothetical protein
VKKATRKDSKLRMALAGPPKSGKTFTALTTAVGIAGPNGRVGLLDSERGSASKYSDDFDFDVEEIESDFSPQHYIKLIKQYEDKYDVLVIDSLSHAWFGKGGALEMADKASARTKNSFTAWREVTPFHNALVDAILQAKCHIIITLRVKVDYVFEKDEKTGKTVPKKIGLAPIMREGIEYEFDVLADMDSETCMISGTRCRPLSGFVEKHANEGLVKPLRIWLGLDDSDGKAVKAKPPTPEVTPEVTLEVTPEVVKTIQEEFPGSSVEKPTDNGEFPDPASYGDISKASPIMAGLMNRIPPMLMSLKNDMSPTELARAVEYAKFEICMAFEVHSFHDIPDEQEENVVSFVKSELVPKLRTAGFLPAVRARG